MPDPADMPSDKRPVPSEFACDVCGNTPDADGFLTHAKDCSAQSEDGGKEFIPEAVKNV